MSETTYWIRGLPPPDDPVGVILVLIGGAVGLLLFWILIRVLLHLLLFLFGPIIRWLNKPI